MISQNASRGTRPNFRCAPLEHLEEKHNKERFHIAVQMPQITWNRIEVDRIKLVRSDFRKKLVLPDRNHFPAKSIADVFQLMSLALLADPYPPRNLSGKLQTRKLHSSARTFWDYVCLMPYDLFLIPTNKRAPPAIHPLSSTLWPLFAGLHSILEKRFFLNHGSLKVLMRTMHCLVKE